MRNHLNAYTDAPELHPNLILGSLHLVGWLFFHPAAWRNHVARVDPTLHPDFTVLELSRAQWRNPAVRRLVFQGSIFWVLLFGLLVGVGQWIMGQLAYDIAYLTTLLVTCMLMLSMTLSLGPALTMIVGGGLSFIIVSAITSSPDYRVASFGLGVLGSVLISLLGRERAHPPTRQLGGVVVGFLAGSVASGIILGLAFLTAGAPTNVILSSLTLGLVSGLGFILLGKWRGRRWRLKTVISVMASVATIGLISGGMYNLVSDELTSVVGNIVVGILTGLTFSMWWGIIFALSYVLAEQIAGPWVGVIASTLCMGEIHLLLETFLYSTAPPFWSIAPPTLGSLFLGLTLAWWRPIVLYPFVATWNTLLYWTDKRRSDARPSLLRYHSAFWDEFQRLPLPGLDDHLVLMMEQNHTEGQAAIEYLSATHQRWAARAAQIELDARRLQRCADVAAIGNAHHSLGAGELEDPVSALLRSFSRISQDAGAALRQENTYNQRLILSDVEDRLDGLIRELARSGDRHAARFQSITTSWRRSVADHLQALAAETEQRQEIKSPYVVGIPLTAQQGIFVGRTDVTARIERLLLDRQRPPVLLYGQRRMGKTSLLKNLGRLMPHTIVPLFVDLQGPASFAANHAGLLYNLARGMISSARQYRDLALPSLAHQELATDPFTRFDEWLDAVEETLGNRTALLALDEFEALDDALVEGRFSEAAVLGLLRHLIQHRPHFQLLITGSHTLSEMQRWANYLINIQILHVNYLSEPEARQLIERPIADFALRYEPDASQRVLDLTRGHPALVQLLCAEIVALKNNQPPAVRRLARLADVEAAVPEALRRGAFLFIDIDNQIDAVGQAVLHFVAAQGERAISSQNVLAHQFPDTLDSALALLSQRELIEPINGGYRFQVELIRHWFARESNSAKQRMANASVMRNPEYEC